MSAKQTVLTSEGIKQRPRILRTLDDLFTAIAITLQREDITRSRLEDQFVVVQNALTRQRTLLVIDNLETIDDEKPLTFLRELPAPTKAIVTTRHRIDVAYPVRLKQMPVNDALKLIEQECIKKSVIFSNEDAQQLYQSTDGVPLAMVWSISQAASGYGVKSILAKLAEHEGDINKYCFSSAFASVKGKSSEQVLFALGVMPKDASREMLGHITNLDELERDGALVLLEMLSLVNKQEDRFSLLQLTKNFILGETSIEQITQYRLRALDWYIDKFSMASMGLGVDSAFQSPYWELKFDYDNFLALIDWGIASENYKHALEGIHYMYDYLWSRGYWSTLLSYLSIGIEIANHQVDRPSLAVFKRDLGKIKNFQGDTQNALANMQSALSIFEELGEKHSYRYIDVLRNIGMILLTNGEVMEAKELLLDLLQRVDKLDHPRKKRLITQISDALAEIYIRESDYLEAEKYVDIALNVAEEIKFGISIIVSTRLRGKLLFTQNKLEESIPFFERSLETSRLLSLLPDQGYAMKWLARVEHKRGNRDLAIEWGTKALNILDRLGMNKDKEEILELFSQQGFDLPVK